MKIEEIKVFGIRSHKETKCSIENYSTLIGLNNCGKSNVLYALRWFFKDIKMNKEDICHRYNDSPYVEIKFKIAKDDINRKFFDESYFNNDTIIVKSYCDAQDVKKEKFTIKHQFIKEGLEPSKDKKIPFEEFVNIIYVPSIRELNDEIKFTTNSTINKLVTEYITSKIIEKEDKNSRYEEVVYAIKRLSEYISTGDDSAINRLKTSIDRYMLGYDGISLNIELSPPEPDEFVKNAFKISVNTPTGETQLSSQGMGFQRSLIFSLICNIAEIGNVPTKFTLYLIEEPENFLHPNHQLKFREKLIEISRKNNVQSMITSHSPYFINNTDNYSQLKRVGLKDNYSYIKEISQSEVESICRNNANLMALAYDECNNPKWTQQEFSDKVSEIEAEDWIRYLLWIDPYRANAFLSSKVILVEGATEKAFFSFIFNHPNGEFYNDKRKTEISVIDVLGKYHFYKFSYLLNRLGIPVWILYDGDDDKNTGDPKISHKKLNSYIVDLKASNIINDAYRVNPHLERGIGLEKSKNAVDISIYKRLVANENKCRNSQEYAKIVSFVDKIIKA